MYGEFTFGLALCLSVVANCVSLVKVKYLVVRASVPTQVPLECPGVVRWEVGRQNPLLSGRGDEAN